MSHRRLMDESEKWLHRPLSRHQLCTIRYVMYHNVRVEHLGQARMNTIASLLTRRFLLRQGDAIVVSDAGAQALHDYESGMWSERKHPGEITDRVRSLLKYARAMKTRAAA